MADVMETHWQFMEINFVYENLENLTIRCDVFCVIKHVDLNLNYRLYSSLTLTPLSIWKLLCFGLNFPEICSHGWTKRPRHWGREKWPPLFILSISLSYLKVVLFLFKFFGNVFLGSSGQHVSFVQIMAGCRFGDKPLSEHCKQEVVNLTTLLVVPPETT